MPRAIPAIAASASPYQPRGEGSRSQLTAPASAPSSHAQTHAPSTRLWLVRAELGLGLCDRALRTTREVSKGPRPHTHPRHQEDAH